MKTISLLPFFLALSAAVPVHESTQKRDPGWEAPFKAVTMRVMKKDPSREEYLQAYESRFWVGGEPSTSCPDNKCSEINETVLNGGKMDSLSVGVEGGQRIYLDADGALRYTSPSDPVMPPGSHTANLNYAYDWVFVPNQPGTWWWACPNPELRKGYYQLFGPFNNITVPGIQDPSKSCYRADVAGFEYTGPLPATYVYN
ncbi:hypothetical protein MGYG_01740 [Nannizzia gypsea CBS 118893]|uniref:IgE-binding protein n=1 Tax=Arthroderma gypseum (strain ATCC MYA-4604 / CBS 118893) TaxID=535722 RepID=E5R318_ARTGP|nr:hypothetical protein MGYG_01740 [Nannizzia gypsea CBS 118893]EFQ98722.1 hypothetical protein MGYG_01740 [Nannizzia gypsea CBS 118893]